MKRGVVFLLFLAPATAAADAPKAWTPDAMLKVKSVAGVHPSPDGKRVAYAVTEAVTEGEQSVNRTHIHLANADGTEPIQLTRGDKSSANPQWSPDGRWVAFTSDRAGKTNLYRIRVAGGEAEQLTDVKSGVGAFAWSPDGKQLAFAMPDPPSADEEKRGKEKDDAFVVDENLKTVRLYVIAAEANSEGKRTPRKLTSGGRSVGGGDGGGATPFDWSPDGKTIAFSHTKTPKVDDWPTADLSMVDVESGKVTPLATTGAAETTPRYSPDGKSVAYVVSDDPPRWATDARVCVVAADGGKPWPLAATPDRRPALLGWSADGRQVYVWEPRGTLAQFYALPADAGQPKALAPEDGLLTGPALGRDGATVGFTWQSPDRPPEAAVGRLDDFKPVAVSKANAKLPKLPAGKTRVVRWKSDDGLEVEGLLTYPAGYEDGKRYPLLLVIHGGPTGVFSQTFTAQASPYPVAAFAGRGYAVLRVNPRGSSGYGRKFRFANYKDWGGGDYRDLMAGVDHVVGMGVADKDRLGVMGWSYGGFMTSWVITQTKRFKAASVGAGVTNLMSFTGTSDIPSFLPDYFGAEPWEDLEAYRTHSAMFQVKGVTTPTLIQHGDKDARVPISQGYELYNALKRQACVAKMVVYPRQPHGIQEPKLLRDAMARNLEWFDRHVRGVTPSEAGAGRAGAARSRGR
jgi:dipeptidyl aminopeptidase/acylaminoacyl peptidase